MKGIALALFVVATSACRRDPPPPSTSSIADASTAEASVLDASGLDASAEASRPPFRRFDPAGRIVHASRNAGGLGVNGTKSEPLTAEQAKRVDAIAKALSESDEPPLLAITALRDELASGVKAGRLDDAKIRARRAELAAAMAPVFGAERLALDELHRVLTPVQRSYAVTMLSPARTLRASGHVKTDLCRSWTKELPLGAAKQKQIEAALPEPQALATSSDQRMDEVGHAFEAEGFEAKKLDVLDPNKKAVLPLDVETEFLRKSLPLLDEPSRKIVAERIANVDPSKLRD